MFPCGTYHSLTFIINFASGMYTLQGAEVFLLTILFPVPSKCLAHSGHFKYFLNQELTDLVESFHPLRCLVSTCELA